MKFKNIETEKGKPVVVTETPRFLRKPLVRRFMAEYQMTENYWSWVELPGYLLVSDRISFQLDVWYKNHKE